MALGKGPRLGRRIAAWESEDTGVVLGAKREAARFSAGHSEQARGEDGNQLMSVDAPGSIVAC